VVAGFVIPPGDGGLRESGHIDTFGPQSSLLRAGKKV